MMILDGSFGEGGGQVLRTSLALSLVTGTPFRIENIRARRKRPGLLRQHLTAVLAASQVAGARVQGASVGSRVLEFEPGPVRGGAFSFSIGTAGSTTLVLQAVLPALLTAREPSTIVIEGGTHNPQAPPFEFLDQTYVPLVNRMGPIVRCTLQRRGFYPAGGGRIEIQIEPSARLASFDLLDRGAIRVRKGVALVTHVPRNVAEREVSTLREVLGWEADCFEVVERQDSRGPGNVVWVEIGSDAVHEIVTAFGQRGVRAESVAQAAARETMEYLASDVPVGSHLADQLVLLLALAGRGALRTMSLTDHTTTQFEVIRRFLCVECRATEERPGAIRIDVVQ